MLANTVLNRIDHYSADGAKLGELLGTTDTTSKTKQLYNIGSLTVASDGCLWITHMFQDGAVRHLFADGKLLGQFGSIGKGVGQFLPPDGLAFASDGSLWQVDSWNHVKTDGRFIEQFEAYNSCSVTLQSVHDNLYETQSTTCEP